MSVLGFTVWSYVYGCVGTYVCVPTCVYINRILISYHLHDSNVPHSNLTGEVTPSFILLAIQGSKVVTYVYELHGDQVDVSKSEFSK